MPKPVNKLAVTKDAIMQIGAAVTRLKKCKKHIDKLGIEERIKALAVITHHAEFLYDELCKDLRDEQRRVKSSYVIKVDD